MLVIATVPIELDEVVAEEVRFEAQRLKVGSLTLPINLGVTALMAASYQVLNATKGLTLKAILTGDKGEGKGTKRLFQYLKTANISPHEVICGHYMMPYVDEFKAVFPHLRKRTKWFVVDAGMMYAAKAAGLAKELDVFTPDVGELAFLADEKATHPAYVKRILFEMDTQDVIPLIKKAYAAQNIPRYLLVKGKEDLIVENGEVVASVAEPTVEAMEAIGGTGDSLVGILTALLALGMPVRQAMIMAAKTNRLAGKLACPTPATSITEIILAISTAIKEVLK